MEKRFDELSKFFCFDRKKTSMEELFGDLTTFFKDFEVCNVFAGDTFESHIIIT